MNGNSVVYVGTEPSMLYISVDNGETWTELKGIQDLPSKENWSFPPRPETHYVRWITPSYSNEDYIAISIEAGAVINSYDGGKTWEDRLEVSPIDAHTLLAHPDAPRKLYAANGDGLSDRKKAYAESKDEGRTWEYKSEGLEEYPYLYHMVVNTEDPNDILVSASKSASTAHSLSGYSTIYRKVGDKSWSELSDGIPCESSYTQHLANDPTKPGAFYAMSNHGIYYLDKGKKLWVKVDIPNLSAYLGDRSYCFAVRQNND